MQRCQSLDFGLSALKQPVSDTSIYRISEATIMGKWIDNVLLMNKVKHMLCIHFGLCLHLGSCSSCVSTRSSTACHIATRSRRWRWRRRRRCSCRSHSSDEGSLSRPVSSILSCSQGEIVIPYPSGRGVSPLMKLHRGMRHVSVIAEDHAHLSLSVGVGVYEQKNTLIRSS